jgi:hypothetical protein
MTNHNSRLSKDKYAFSSFSILFYDMCYQDILKLCIENYGAGVSWQKLNQHFSIKHRFTKNQTRMLVRSLSYKYPISWNKFFVFADTKKGGKRYGK